MCTTILNFHYKFLRLITNTCRGFVAIIIITRGFEVIIITIKYIHTSIITMANMGFITISISDLVASTKIINVLYYNFNFHYKFNF